MNACVCAGDGQRRQRLHYDFNRTRLAELGVHAYTVYINLSAIPAELSVRLKDGDIVTILVPAMRLMIFRDDQAHAGEMYDPKVVQWRCHFYLEPLEHASMSFRTHDGQMPDDDVEDLNEGAVPVELFPAETMDEYRARQHHHPKRNALGLIHEIPWHMLSAALQRLSAAAAPAM